MSTEHVVRCKCQAMKKRGWNRHLIVLEWKEFRSIGCIMHMLSACSFLTRPVLRLISTVCTYPFISPEELRSLSQKNILPLVPRCNTCHPKMPECYLLDTYVGRYLREGVHVILRFYQIPSHFEVDRMILVFLSNSQPLESKENCLKHDWSQDSANKIGMHHIIKHLSYLPNCQRRRPAQHST